MIRSTFMPRRIAATLTCAMAALLPGLNASAADANELFAIGAIQKSMGGSGVASPQDATWTLLNPATIVDLSDRVDVLVEWLRVGIRAEPRGVPILSNPFAGEISDHSLVPIASFGGVKRLKKGVVGYGMFGVLGNRADYNRARATLAIPGNGDRRSGYEVARIPIAYARELENGWALGAAVVPTYTRFRTDSLTLRLRTTEGDYEWDVGFGVAFKLGIYKRWDQWSVGATYMSRTWMQDYDKYEDDLVRWNLDQPQRLQLGFAYRPREDVELTMDYKWTNWSDSQLLGRKTIRGGLGWKDQHIVKAGLSWRPNDKWTFRGGVSAATGTISDEFVFANILTPALGQYHFGVGFSYRVTPRTTFHMTWSQSIPESRTDNGQGDLFSVLGRGSTASYKEQSLTFQYSYEF